MLVYILFYTCYFQRMFNIVLNIRWCCWFSSPDFHFSGKGLDMIKICLFLRKSVDFIIHVQIRSMVKSRNIDFLVSYTLIVNGSCME